MRLDRIDMSRTLAKALIRVITKASSTVISVYPERKYKAVAWDYLFLRDFVEAHGGTLTVESELGKGSRFVMRLKA